MRDLNLSYCRKVQRAENAGSICVRAPPADLNTITIEGEVKPMRRARKWTGRAGESRIRWAK